MTKIEKVRQFMEISGTGDTMTDVLRNYVAQVIPQIAKAGGLDEKEISKLMVQLDAQVLLSMPGFVSACTQALADIWTDEIVDYQLEQCQHPLSKAERDLRPIFQVRMKEISEAWAQKLTAQIKIEEP